MHTMASFTGSIEQYKQDYDLESYCEKLEQLFLFNNVVDKFFFKNRSHYSLHVLD